MDVIAEHLGGVLELQTPRFGDDRGTFSVTFEKSNAADLGIDKPFVQDNQSVSSRPGTLRGIHLQEGPHAQGKLVRVLAGRILDVVVDVRPASPTVGQHVGVELNAEDGNQLWVPRGFGHSFCTLEPDTIVFYKVDAPWRPDAERTIAFDDPALGIKWPFAAEALTLSEKDADGRSFEAVLEAERGDSE